MKEKIMFITGLGLLLILGGSCKKDNNGSADKTETQIVNQWIYDGLTAVYFWNKAIPSGLDPLTEPDPKELFHKMLYTSKDHWSYITDDYSALEADLQGVPLSMGYSPTFGLIANTNKVAIFVEYVYPGSPAEAAGLKRGDFIMSIDGQDLNLDNYYDLYSKNDYSAGLGDYSTGSLKSNGRSVNLSAEVINADPILYSAVIDTNSSKTGYLVFTQFTPGVSNAYLTELGSVMDNFKSQGINNLIVDLRYNRGGSISVAQYLASCIAPATNVTNQDVLVRYQYNQEVNDYFIKNEGETSSSLIARFNPNGHNLNLSRVFFITGRGTASASELVITGLEPYMQVTTIGDTTVGKYTGMWVIPDTQDPPRHNWGMMPVVLKYANADGLTDFEDGLAPDYYVQDNMKAAVEFGNFTDNMFNKAMELATGMALPVAARKAATAETFTRIRKDPRIIKENLIFPSTKTLRDLSATSLEKLPEQP